MESNFERALDHLLEVESGFVMNPKDPGGMTNLGVTRMVWEMYKKSKVDEAEMRRLTRADVTPLYRTHYWDACKCDALPGGVDYAVFDFAVNSGNRRAARTLQEVVGVNNVDGVIGPATIAACERQPAREVIEDLMRARLDFLKSLPTWADFGRGWTNRVNKVLPWALAMA